MWTAYVQYHPVNLRTSERSYVHCMTAIHSSLNMFNILHRDTFVLQIEYFSLSEEHLVGIRFGYFSSYDMTDTRCTVYVSFIKPVTVKL